MSGWPYQYVYSRLACATIKWGSGNVTESFNAIYEPICPRSLFNIDFKEIFKINQHWMVETTEMQDYRDILRRNAMTAFNLTEVPKVWGF